MKRVMLFLATNLLVVLTISVLVNALGLRPYLSSRGVDYRALMVFCLIWGMGGAFISLLISRWMAKRAMGVQVLDANTTDPGEQALLQMVQRLAQGANLPMPEVGVFQSDAINAFATGPSKKRSLVAVSTGLWRKMNREEAEAVLGHEIAHIANGDMVTMTLLQGVVNAFVMFLARAIGFALAQAMRRDDSEGVSYGMQMIVVFALEMVFMIFGSMVVMAFSRAREFRADSGGAQLAGRGKMIAALERLQRDVEAMTAVPTPPGMRAMMISGGGGVARLFMSHPPLAERIERLRSSTV
jgi:heat shock protein HtpX